MTRASDVLYHYTRQATLISVFDSDELWLTDVRYLNDTSEYIYTTELAQQVLRELGEGPSLNAELRTAVEITLIEASARLMVCSLSEESDLLSQWRGYCDLGAGVAVGFKRSILEQIAREHGGHLRKARYDIELQKRLLRRQLEYVARGVAAGKSYAADLPNSRTLAALASKPQLQLIARAAGHFVTQLFQMASFFKHPTFSEEREWRIVLPRPATVRFRSGKSYVVPYTAMQLHNNKTHVIQDVVIGPTPNPRLTEAAIRELVAQNCPYPVSVRSSQIPFRAW